MMKITPHKWVHERDHESIVITDSFTGSCITLYGAEEIGRLHSALDSYLRDISLADAEEIFDGR